VRGPNARHTAVVDAMLSTVQRLAVTDYPVRFVVSSGDAILWGPNGTMWNVSYTPVVERITRQAGLPLFFAPGNHDTTARPAGDPDREHGLRNTLNAMAKLMPPNGSPRRLDGYATFSFGYGNTFFVFIDSNIATDQPARLDGQAARGTQSHALQERVRGLPPSALRLGTARRRSARARVGGDSRGLSPAVPQASRPHDDHGP
jgi:hypothetical protein